MSTFVARRLLVQTTGGTTIVRRVLTGLATAGPPGSVGDPAELQEAVNEFLTDNPEMLTGPLLEHIEDPTPHPAYDDMPDLTLLIENVLT